MEHHCTYGDDLVSEVRERRNLPGPAEATAIRKLAKVSQSRLAAELGVHRVTVARWETGERNPRGEVVERYAALLRALALETGSARKPRLPSTPREAPTRLRSLRARKGWTLRLVAGLAPVSLSRLSAIERRLAVPSAPEIARLCALFEWPTDRAAALFETVDDS